MDWIGQYFTWIEMNKVDDRWHPLLRQGNHPGWVTPEKPWWVRLASQCHTQTFLRSCYPCQLLWISRLFWVCARVLISRAMILESCALTLSSDQSLLLVPELQRCIKSSSQVQDVDKHTSPRGTYVLLSAVERNFHPTKLFWIHSGEKLLWRGTAAWRRHDTTNARLYVPY